MVGPFDEGAKLTLRCDVIGGRPSPQVTWWLNNELVDSSYESPKAGVVRNVLKIGSLTRKHLHSSLACVASNGNTTTPKQTHITIEMNFKPISVKILRSRGALSAGRTFELSCQSVGARPPAIITWLLNGRQLNGSKIKKSASSNITTSILYLTPSSLDEGKILTCRAVSPVIKHPPLSDDWRLRVNYTPTLRLKLGTSLDGDNIKERDDVYFECEVEANPKIYKIEWYHQGILLKRDRHKGIIFSNQTLVLQTVQREHSGAYTCIGSNIEGDGESNAFTLNVKYTPVCADNQPLVYGAARYEKVTVLCQLEAVPGNVTFSWRFNNSGDVVDISDNHITTNGLQSSLSYVAKTELDFGTLLCWGKNALGIQKVPCSFQVVPAGPPESPNNCSVTNSSTSVIHIKCMAGYDGGLDQSFTAEAYDINNQGILSNITLTVPYFKITGLQQGSAFKILIYSSNSKGISKERTVTAYTLKDVAEKRTAPVRPPPEELEWPISPLLAVCVGVVGSLLLVPLVVILVVRQSKEKRKHVHKNITLATATTSDDKDLEELNPDVIPDKDYDPTALLPLGDDGGFIPASFEKNLLSGVPYPPQVSSTLPRAAKGSTQPSLQAGDLMYAELLLPNKKQQNKISTLHQGPTVYAKLEQTPLVNGGLGNFTTNPTAIAHSNYYSTPFEPSDHQTELLMQKGGRSVKSALVRPSSAGPVSQPLRTLNAREFRTSPAPPGWKGTAAYDGYIPPPAFVPEESSPKTRLLKDHKESEV